MAYIFPSPFVQGGSGGAAGGPPAPTTWDLPVPRVAAATVSFHWGGGETTLAALWPSGLTECEVTVDETACEFDGGWSPNATLDPDANGGAGSFVTIWRLATSTLGVLASIPVESVDPDEIVTEAPNPNFWTDVRWASPAPSGLGLDDLVEVVTGHAALLSGTFDAAYLPTLGWTNPLNMDSEAARVLGSSDTYTIYGSVKLHGRLTTCEYYALDAPQWHLHIPGGQISGQPATSVAWTYLGPEMMLSDLLPVGNGLEEDDTAEVSTWDLPVPTLSTRGASSWSNDFTVPPFSRLIMTRPTGVAGVAIPLPAVSVSDGDCDYVVPLASNSTLTLTPGYDHPAGQVIPSSGAVSLIRPGGPSIEWDPLNLEWPDEPVLPAGQWFTLLENNGDDGIVNLTGRHF